MISPSMKKILLQRTALHIFWLQFYPLKGSTYGNFCWCEWERVTCVIAAIRQAATVYLFLGYCKCCPHFFSWQGQMNLQWIPLPWAPFCGISLLITPQHWQSSLSSFLMISNCQTKSRQSCIFLTSSLPKPIENFRRSCCVWARDVPHVLYNTYLLSFLEFVLDVQRFQKINTDVSTLAMVSLLLWEKCYLLY